MAPEADKKGKELSAEEKLRAADKDLSQLREILASMDEIDALRKRDGKPETGEYGGYKRADVTAMIAELEQQRRVLLADISNSGRADSAPGPSGTRERVTLSDALERMYAAIAGNIEHAKGEILREIRYSCRQNTAIYAELSARMDAVADKVLAKVMAGGVDYDELAKRIVLQMTGRGESDAIAALEKRIEELEAALAAQRQAAQPSLTESETISAAREAEPELAEEQTAEEEEPSAEPAAREAMTEPAEEQAEGDVAAADAAAAGPQSAEPIEEPISEEQTSEEQLPEESGDLAEEQLPEERGDLSEEQQPEESGDLAEEEGAADAADERAEEELAEIPGEDNSFERESAECEAENAEASAEPSIDAGEAEADLAEHGEAAADSDEIQREEADEGIEPENEDADPSEK
ncbi:MAG TPA: hypothetical protein H9737_06310 [Candidatus Borkfalkia faecigallinarum]|uniref:Uncharacterized protein n=1 Tax=Candidatus Borkfalkia faecigallinarum TaxID=2838509 RepID=A0A9D1VUU6_9FIRM|nr:hypothetical protein [Candidatus Borkfalkia faecigallinarum]